MRLAFLPPTLARIESDSRSGAHHCGKPILPNRHAKLQRQPDISRRRRVQMRTKQRSVGLRALIGATPLGEIQRMRRQPRVGLANPVGTLARPAVLARIGHHPSANRFEFDGAVAGQQIRFGLNEAGFVAPFPLGLPVRW